MAGAILDSGVLEPLEYYWSVYMSAKLMDSSGVDALWIRRDLYKQGKQTSAKH